jgi:hypothetical protein
MVLPFAFGAQSKTRIPIPLSTRCPWNFSDSGDYGAALPSTSFWPSGSRKIIPYEVFRALSYSPESDENLVSHTIPYHRGEALAGDIGGNWLHIGC